MLSFLKNPILSSTGAVPACILIIACGVSLFSLLLLTLLFVLFLMKAILIGGRWFWFAFLWRPVMLNIFPCASGCQHHFLHDLNALLHLFLCSWICVWFYSEILVYFVLMWYQVGLIIIFKSKIFYSYLIYIFFFNFFFPKRKVKIKVRSNRKGDCRSLVNLAHSLCINFRISQDFLPTPPQLHWNFEKILNLELSLGRFEVFTRSMSSSLIQVIFYVLQQSLSFCK